MNKKLIVAAFNKIDPRIQINTSTDYEEIRNAYCVHHRNAPCHQLWEFIHTMTEEELENENYLEMLRKFYKELQNNMLKKQKNE